jgi:hypothetical protein
MHFTNLPYRLTQELREIKASLTMIFMGSLARDTIKIQ